MPCEVAGSRIDWQFAKWSMHLGGVCAIYEAASFPNGVAEPQTYDTIHTQHTQYTQHIQHTHHTHGTHRTHDTQGTHTNIILKFMATYKSL